MQAGLSKVACELLVKITAYLVSMAGYFAWHFFTDGVFYIKNISGLAAHFDNSVVYFKPFSQPCA